MISDDLQRGTRKAVVAPCLIILHLFILSACSGSGQDGGSAGAYVADKLGLPEGMEVLAIMAIGHPREEKKAHPMESLQAEKVSWERFGQQR